jgi:hypothetical protein
MLCYDYSQVLSIVFTASQKRYFCQQCKEYIEGGENTARRHAKSKHPLDLIKRPRLPAAQEGVEEAAVANEVSSKHVCI